MFCVYWVAPVIVMMIILMMTFVVGQKPFRCPQCPVTFSTKSNRERHMIRKHGLNVHDPATRQMMDRPYKCHLCVFSSFATSGNLGRTIYLILFVVLISCNPNPSSANHHLNQSYISIFKSLKRWLLLCKPWKTKGFSFFEIIITVLFSFFHLNTYGIGLRPLGIF